MQTLMPREWREVWIRLFEHRPALIRILLKRIHVHFSKQLKFDRTINQTWQKISKKTLRAKHTEMRKKQESPILFQDSSKWLCIDLLCSPEQSKRFLWPRSYLLALDSLGPKGDFIVLAFSRPLSMWCHGMTFQHSRFSFHPKVIDLSDLSVSVFWKTDPRLALLGFFIHRKADANQALLFALSVIACAYQSSFVDAIHFFDLVLWMSSQRLKTILLKKILSPQELLKDREKRYMTREIEEFISFLENRGRTQAALEIFKELIQTHLKKFDHPLPDSLQQRFHHILDVPTLKMLYEQLLACENFAQVLVCIQNTV